MLRRIWVLLGLLSLLTVAVPSTHSVGVSAAPDAATVGLVDPDNGRWYLRSASGDVHAFFYGDPGDEPFLGDWDCDGVDTPGLYRRADGYVYLRNSNTAGIADVRFYFGNPGDFPVAGDFDGDGCDTVSLYRPEEARVYVINRLGSDDRGLGAADAAYVLGQPGDVPFAGDFDGDGVDTLGALRPGTGRVLLRNAHRGGDADVAYTFGDPGDRPVIGPWGGGPDSVGVYRPAAATFYFRHDHGGGPADHALGWGEPGWLPVAGRLDGPPVAATPRAAAIPEDSPAPVTPPTPAPEPPAPEPPAPEPPAPEPPAPEPPAPEPPAPEPPVTFPPAPADPPAATPPPGNTPEDTDVYVGEDIQAAVDANPPGATITIKAGVHRLAEVLPKDGQTFAGEPGAVLSGARLLTGFAAEDGAWIVDGQEQQGQLHGECAPLPGGAYDASCRYPEDLYFDDAPLRQVTDRAELGPGHWYFDYAADRIYVADDPTGHRVEVSVARHAFFPWAPGAANAYPADVTIRDLVVEKYANPAQHGAIHAGGFDDGGPGQGMTEGWAIVGTEVRLNHGAGVRTGHGTLVADSHIHHNGQLGVRVRGRDVSLVGNEISHNNTLGFAIGWEAGGVKSMYTTRLEVRANHVHDNRGFGLWTDTDNIDTRYEGNTVAANAGAGIFHEASYAAQVIGNVVTGNGHETDGWFYGAGILIAHSPDVEVANNVLAGNADGIGAIQQDRASGAYGPHRLDNLWVHDNDVTLDGGLHGVGEDIGDPGVFDRNLRFEGNEYQLDGVTAPFAWDNLFLDAAGWHGYGHDLPAG